MKDRALPSEDAEAGAIHKAQQGDLGAFNTLVLAHQEIAYRVAYRILGERDAAADAIQDSFLKAYRKLGQFRGGSFRAWLLRIVVNTCYDLLRSEKRHPSCSLGGDDPGDEDEGGLPGGGESPEECAIRRELHDRIQAALGRLPADQRVVVILRDIEGVTYEEIAASTGMQLGTVKSRLSRGRSRLRDLLMVDAGPTGSRPQRTGTRREALPAACDVRAKGAALARM